MRPQIACAKLYAALRAGPQPLRVLPARGCQRLGVRALWERMRWSFAVDYQAGEYKLNDHFPSRYARLIAEREPDLARMFEVRELRAE
jgi:hypothetical protein